MVRLVPSNMFKLSSKKLFTNRSKAVFLRDTLCHLCFMSDILSCIVSAYCNATMWSPAVIKADLLALLYVMFFVVLLLSHVVSWVRCDT